MIWNLKAILSHSWIRDLLPAYSKYSWPLSLGRLPFNNVQYREFLSTLNYEVISQFLIYGARYVIIDEKDGNGHGKAWMWASTEGETVIGPYKNEIVMILKFGADGRVEWIGKFTDSFPNVREYLKKQSKNSISS
ncbi:hypothetical protein D9758_014486 [Tetrapyrgos nigripes]|uniref:Uncharacterized protein n=1 Tax=Tetrapyrgos nigripes TaxID=182062 RepID=A0A8H5FH71_9AGAR|nr:hypothetical protein D9758_014486 [Tetrapyrgos nigripes]